MRRQLLRHLAIVGVVGAVMCGAAGCGGGAAEEAAEAAIEAQTGSEVDVDADAGTMTIRDGEGGEIAFAGDEGGVELPDDFPSTIPIYPDALPIQYMNMGEGVQAGFKVAAPLDDVREWYIEQLEDQSWGIQMNMVTADGAMVAAEREGVSLSLMLATDEEMTTIVVTAGQD